MKAKHLITYTALLLPMGLAHAQYGASQPTPTPSESPAPSAAPAQSETPAPSQAAAGGNKAGTVQATPATAADLAKGKVINDPSGNAVGTIDAITASGVVLAVGKLKVQIPKTAIGKTESGLVIAMTRTEVEAAANKRSPS